MDWFVKHWNFRVARPPRPGLLLQSELPAGRELDSQIESAKGQFCSAAEQRVRLQLLDMTPGASLSGLPITETQQLIAGWHIAAGWGLV